LGVPVTKEGGPPRIQYCCTPGVNCSGSVPGEVISRHNINIHVFRVDFKNGNDTALMQEPHPIEKAGNYILHIINCQGFEVTVTGMIVSRNPYGYLPGEMFMLLPVSGFIALTYMLVLVLYTVLCVIHRKVLMKIQYGILAVLAFGLVEYSAWFFYRLGTNNSGFYNTSGLVFVVFLANVQRIITRVLYLLVSMGFGIVK